ncbi:MAG: hypothetical protein LBL61_03685 [Elusimicrobiota bacterium]|jgi:glycerol kinase|nr:hypothetical protein [Elusimicrobiota bacterium]
MKNKIIIALDQGSSSSRAAAVTHGGEVLFKEALPVSLKVDGPRCEYDARTLLQTQISVLDKVLAACKGRGEITDIAICAQRSTIVLWDSSDGAPLCPALSWLDGRAAAFAAADMAQQQFIRASTGLYKTPFYSAPKIQWCLQNYPGVQAALKAGRLLCGPVASYLIWHMNGGKVFAADITNAQRMLLFNIKTLQWDEEILKSFSVPRGILPQVLPTAADYGSYKNIPITVCAGDQQASAAAALPQKGDCIINCGTGAFALLNIGPEAADVQGLLTSAGFNTAAQTRPDFILEGPVNAAGSLFAWLNSLGINFDIKDLDALCAASKTPAQFYPALGGIGAPLWDFALKPVIAGLTPQSTKEDIIAGAMRGLCFLLADIINCAALAGFEAKCIRAGGGLSASTYLLKFLAGILQRPIIRVKENEAAALGAAYIATTAAGIDAAGWQAFRDYEVFEPAMPPREAAALNARWRDFAAWARSQPR